MTIKQLFSHILIFTDGACSGNPGPGGWGSVAVTPSGKVQELGAGAQETTNNRMEMTAVARAIMGLGDEPGDLTVYTDSVYVIRGLTQWIHGWRRRGWKNAAGEDVANKDLWIWLEEVVSSRKPLGKVDWQYVRGHMGIPGNERCDEIAVAFAKNKPISLYNGHLLNYAVPIYDLPELEALPEPRKKEAIRKKAHSYLSVVGGVAERHGTWAECERRVKGQSGAKFKKALSQEDESKILSGWGVRLP